MHPRRHTVAEERKVLQHQLCSKEKLAINERLLADYPDDQDLAETNILIRRGQMSARLRKGLSRWYDSMAMSGCFRDQLTFNYALWKEAVDYRLLPMQEKPWCKRFKHDDPNEVRWMGKGQPAPQLQHPPGSLTRKP